MGGRQGRRKAPVQVDDFLLRAAHLDFPFSLLTQEQEALFGNALVSEKKFFSDATTSRLVSIHTTVEAITFS